MWYGFAFSGESALEVHAFVDGSKCAYGTVAYLQIKSASEFK